MNRETYGMLEDYMLSCMGDSAHDSEHIYRVLYNALEIARYEDNVDYDVLICACLLHDIGRREQFENPELCHAQVGARKAYDLLMHHGFAKAYAEAVSHCISAHRYRQGNPPQSIEAKILFDADKLDVTGAIGIARTLLYQGNVGEPLYTLGDNGRVSDGTNDAQPSFFQEYRYKLEKMYSRFFTAKGAELARSRQAAAVSFYESLLYEVSAGYEDGRRQLDGILK